MRSPTALSVADVRANSAICMERCGDAIRDVFGELTGDAEGRHHHLAGRDVLPEEDCPLSHGDRRQFIPGRIGYEVAIAVHQMLVRHRCW